MRAPATSPGRQIHKEGTGGDTGHGTRDEQGAGCRNVPEMRGFPWATRMPNFEEGVRIVSSQRPAAVGRMALRDRWAATPAGPRQTGRRSGPMELLGDPGAAGETLIGWAGGGGGVKHTYGFLVCSEISCNYISPGIPIQFDKNPSCTYKTQKNDNCGQDHKHMVPQIRPSEVVGGEAGVWSNKGQQFRRIQKI